MRDCSGNFILAKDPGLRYLFGQICWGATASNLLNLSVNFGRPVLKILREPDKGRQGKEARRLVVIRGEWWLWAYVANWRISHARKFLASSSSPSRKRNTACAYLQGQRIESMQIMPKTYKTRLKFDLGYMLEISRTNSESRDEVWLLYEPNGYVLSLRGDGTVGRNLASGVDGRMKNEAIVRTGLILPRQRRRQ